MKVTTRHIGCVSYVNVVDDCYDMSLMIPDGLTASEALRNEARDLQERAERLIKRSTRMLLAADEGEK